MGERYVRLISAGETFHAGPQGQSGPVLPTPPVTANICLRPKTSREVLLKSVCLVARISPPGKQGWRLVFKP